MTTQTNNVKSKQVRHAVIDALKSLNMSYEKYCHKGKTPPNGLVLLAGSICFPSATGVATSTDHIPCYV